MKLLFILTLLPLLFLINRVLAQCSVEVENEGHRRLAFATKEPLFQIRQADGIYTIAIGSFGMSVDTSSTRLYVIEITISSPINNRLLPYKLNLFSSNGENVSLGDGQGREEKSIESKTGILIQQSYYFYLTTKQAQFILMTPIDKFQIYDTRRADNGLVFKPSYNGIIKDQLTCISSRLY